MDGASHAPPSRKKTRVNVYRNYTFCVSPVYRTYVVDYLAILNSSPVGMLLVDQQFDIVFANAKAEAMFGYASGELNGMPVNCLVPEQMRPAHTGSMSKFFGADSSRGCRKGATCPCCIATANWSRSRSV